VIAKPKYTMYHSTVLESDPDTVWAELRNVLNVVKILFGDTVADVRWGEHGGPELVPSRYEFTLLPSQGHVRQEVAGRNELQRSITYRSVASVLCLYDYVATYRVLPVTNDPGRSYLEYSREFMVTDDAEPEVVEALMNMMDNQINILRDYFATPAQ
jgi:hypothetical protein